MTTTKVLIIFGLIMLTCGIAGAALMVMGVGGLWGGRLLVISMLASVGMAGTAGVAALKQSDKQGKKK